MIKQFGKFQLTVKNVLTGVVQDTGWIDNLVLNNAFNYIFSPASGFVWKIQLGTGSTAPALSDTALETFLVSKTAGTPSSSKAGASTSFANPIYSTSAGWEVSFALGEVVGNLSEIGVSASNNLVTRALITDGAGDPTTIVVGVNDILTVNYLMGYEIDTSHAAGSVTVDFDGVNINLTARWVDLGKGNSCTNGMNGQILPYLNDSPSTRTLDVIETLPSDPLSDIDGGTTPISYLTPISLGFPNWSAGLSPTGSSWIVSATFTSSTGEHTGNWNGIAFGSAPANQPVVIFEFDSTFVKSASQQVTINVKYELQRA